MDALYKIKAAGFTLNLVGDSFQITPASRLTTSQREFLKAHKAEIIQEQSVNCANSSISKNDEQTILTWLRLIGETNKENIEEVLQQCQTEPGALEYFLKRSTEIPVTSDLDDRRY